MAASNPTEDLGTDASKQAHWNRIAERGSLWALRFMLAFYRILGRRISSPLVIVIVSYFFLTDGPGRRASRAYLNRVYGTAAGRSVLGGPPGLWSCHRHYRSFATAIVDRLAIWLGGGGEFLFETHGMEQFDELVRGGRGAIIVGAHLGSFDALRLLARRSDKIVNVLMYTQNARLINSIFEELSPNAEARVIAAAPNSVQAVFAVRECLRRGEHVAILGDRVDSGDGSRTVSVDMLGGPVRLPQAPALLACVLGCPLVLMLALRDGPSHYSVFSEILSEGKTLPRGEREVAVKQLVEAYSSRLEHYCTQAPYQWFNFFDYWAEFDSADDSR